MGLLPAATSVELIFVEFKFILTGFKVLFELVATVLFSAPPLFAADNVELLDSVALTSAFWDAIPLLSVTLTNIAGFRWPTVTLCLQELPSPLQTPQRSRFALDSRTKSQPTGYNE